MSRHHQPPFGEYTIEILGPGGTPTGESFDACFADESLEAMQQDITDMQMIIDSERAVRTHDKGVRIF